MTAKRRPKVRYVARGSSPYHYWVEKFEGKAGGEVVCDCDSRAPAKRIAAALNWHEARKRGEL